MNEDEAIKRIKEIEDSGVIEEFRDLVMAISLKHKIHFSEMIAVMLQSYIDGILILGFDEAWVDRALINIKETWKESYERKNN